MRIATRLLALLLACAVLGPLGHPGTANAQPVTCCIVPDNGTGTADHPPACSGGYMGQTQIVNGLPVGATIDIATQLLAFAGLVQVPGGALGGNSETWTASMPMQMSGTGPLLGYTRNLVMPISAGTSHSAPRTPFAPTQSFATDLNALQGQLPFGDPDFDLLRITAGTNFGLPSPGHTIFTQAAGGWLVDSFFDITYRIDFIGSQTGPFAGRSGSTTGTYRFEMCHSHPTTARKGTWGAIKAFYR